MDQQRETIINSENVALILSINVKGILTLGFCIFLVYNDPFYCKLSEIIRVNIKFCERMDVNVPLATKNNKIDFHLKAAYVTNVSFVDTTSFNSELSTFSISDGQSSECDATLLANKYYSSRSLFDLGLHILLIIPKILILLIETLIILTIQMSSH